MPLGNLIHRVQSILPEYSAARIQRSDISKSRHTRMRRVVVWVRALVVCAGLLGLSGVPAQAQTTAATVTVGPNPSALAVNPVTNKIYVANRKFRTVNNERFCDVTSVVTVIDGATDVTTSVQAGYCPSAIAANPATNRIYVANENGNNVTVIDGAVEGALENIPVGDTPIAIAVNPVTNKIYVANNEDDSVTVIDGATDTVTATVAVGTDPVQVAVNSVTNKIYVVNGGRLLTGDEGNLTVIDGQTNQILNVGTGPFPLDVAVNPATNTIYVVYQGDTDNAAGLTVIDGATDSNSSGSIGIAAPSSITVNPVTSLIYVANAGNNSVTVINWPTFLDFRSTQTVSIGGIPQSLAVNPVTNKIYVSANFSGYVTEIDGDTNATTKLPVPGGFAFLAPVAVNPLTNKIYVANYDGHTVTVLGATNPTSTPVGAGSGAQTVDLNPMTNTIYVANADSANVTVIDGATNATTTVGADSNPIALAVNPMTNKIYVANAVGNDVTVIDAGNNNTAVNVPAGPGPNAVAVNPLTNKIYVANSGSLFSKGSVTVIDGATNTTTTVGAGSTYFLAAAVNPATNTIYVSNCLDLISFQQCSVEVIDGATDNPVASVATGSAPLALAVNPVTNTIYVANGNDDNVTVIDGATNTPIATVATGGDPSSLAVNSATNTIYVSNFATGTVTVIDGAANETTATIPIGQTTSEGANGVVVNPATNTIYVADNMDNTVTVIDGSSLTSTTVAAGSQPFSVAVNPVTNKAYVGNQSNTVTLVVEQQVQTVPLTTTISPLPNNQTNSPTPKFTFTASSTFSPTAPPPDEVYFQVETWQGTWTGATATGPGSFTGTLPPLLPGLHILYAYATDGQDTVKTSSPLIGNIAAYLFLVTSSGAAGGPPPAITPSPARVDLGTVFHDKEVSKKLRLTNTSGALLTNLRVTLVPGAGRDPDDYELDSECPDSLAAGESCRVRISLGAEKVGRRTATIQISYSGAGSPQLVPVTATVVRHKSRRDDEH